MNEKKTTYSNLGVSSAKEDVHAAIKDVDKGLFPSAFCKVIPDIFTGDDDYCVVFHADGAGTKSIISYLYWKEYDDPSIFKGISQDALVMNVDDIACTGLVTDFVVSNTIGRNKFLVSGEVIKAIIEGYQDFAMSMAKNDVNIQLCGGETADVGDLVRTVIVDSTVVTRGLRKNVIETKNIVPGDVIVGLSSTGKTSYESEENSGISSNGITLARHTVINHDYVAKYPEILDPNVDKNLAYAGKFFLEEKLPNSGVTIGKSLLSPTRTYLPVLNALFGRIETSGTLHESIHGIIHNTGGGQTKCLKFGSGLKYIKNDLFPIPAIFSLIQEEGNVDWEEMYRVFNIGHRLEIMCPEEIARQIIEISKGFKLDSRIIGTVEKGSRSEKNELEIESENGRFNYS
ncbi:MAG: AIR synthase related protein [Candidatus Hodarchaeota archaeon]